MTRFTSGAAIGLVFFFLFAAPAAAASPPTITYSIEGISGTNGWYRGSVYGDNVILHWSVLGATSPTCLPVAIPGPTTGTTEMCSATNSSGTVTVVTPPIKIDATPPTVSASITRKPDFNGWYNHPVAVRWSGTDATSGIADCSSVTYRGPENGAATVDGSCTDKAGNSAVQPVHLAYDATPPVLSKVTERSTAGANVLRWSSSTASDRVVVRRAIRGSKAHKTVGAGAGIGSFADRTIRPGAQYVYSVQSFDQAGNASPVVTVAGLPKVLTLRKTGYVPRVATNPILRWGRFRGAGYYNVQLFRGSKRIYAAWPTAHHLGLPTSWKWSRRRFRLSPGRYRWYVWAGLGARTLARYRSVGSASFIVPRR